MSDTTITIIHGSDEYSVTADFSQAASPIMLDGSSTPFQVADAGHRPTRAAAIVAEWLDLGDDWEWDE